jgi:hypothetical protein
MKKFHNGVYEVSGGCEEEERDDCAGNAFGDQPRNPLKLLHGVNRV